MKRCSRSLRSGTEYHSPVVCRSENGASVDDITELELMVRCFAVRGRARRRNGLEEVSKRARMGSVQEAASTGSNQYLPRNRLVN